MLRVWVEGWQLQCCGEPVTVGAPVTWTLDDQPDRAYLQSVLGADLAATVTHSEDHHGLVPEDTPALTGLVREVQAVFCRYAPRPGDDPRTAYPVPGTLLMRRQHRGDGWERESDDQRFVGYLVQVEEPQVGEPPVEESARRAAG